MLVEILHEGRWTLLVAGYPASVYLFVRPLGGPVWFRTERGHWRALAPDQDLFQWPVGFGHALAVGSVAPEPGARCESARYVDESPARAQKEDEEDEKSAQLVAQLSAQLVEFPAPGLVRFGDLVQRLPEDPDAWVSSEDGSAMIGVYKFEYHSAQQPFLFLQTWKHRVVLARRSLGAGSEPMRLVHKPEREREAEHVDTRDGLSAKFESFKHGLSMCTAICIT